MTRHIKSCLAKRGLGSNMLLLVQDRSGLFWVYVTADASIALLSVDWALRNLWLECCGHMSAFSDISVMYLEHPESGLPGMGSTELGMDVSLKKAMQSAETLKYEYDFGSTTQLTIRRLAENVSPVNDENLAVLARNDLPQINCLVCEKPATILMVEDWEPEPYCEACWSDSDERMTLPVINSPRMGVCGYDGPSVEP